MNDNDLKKLRFKLPSSPGILGKDEYLNSAVLIPLVMIDGEYNFLFEKRAAHIRQGGEVCFPGGEYDPKIDSSFRETAIRETVEELGIKKENISVIGILDTLIGPMGVTVDSFIGVISDQNVPELSYDENEVEKIFLLPVSFFEKNEPKKYHVRLQINPNEIDSKGELINTLPVKELNLPEQYAKPWQERKHNILVYETKQGVIWGLTAALINEVVQKLKS